MKKIGFVLISFGVATLLFVFISYIKSQDRFLSPIPENKGVKVIFVSPTQTK